MATSRITEVQNLGTVKVTKKRGVKRLTLRLHPSGEIRVSQPFYLPFSAGLVFAKSHSSWILSQRKSITDLILADGMAIGKNHTLHIEHSLMVRTRVSDNKIVIKTNDITSIESIIAAKTAIKRALNKEAKEQLPPRLKTLADKYGYTYKTIHTKPLKSRWGACSNRKDITLNCYLMMFPWELIDYVILHELSHTKYMNHGPDFWNEVASTVPDYKERKKEIKRLQPNVHRFYM